MRALPDSIERLVRELSRLPSIGEKSALRLAYHLISGDRQQAERLSAALVEAAAKVRFCERCFHFADETFCSICRTPGRDVAKLCVVEKPMDILAMERMGEFNGYYHVLHGLWAPLRGLGPDKLKLKELQQRLSLGEIQEVILALSSTVEGDATSLYLARMAGDLGLRSTRLAQGLPKGGELEYADDLTLSRALAGRNILAP